jgi:CheY-like chemotaxis protein
MLLAKKIGKENNAKLYHFEATDGKKSSCIRNKLDVILMDIQMPKKNVLKLLLQLES